jgi:hypothetical protein
MAISPNVLMQHFTEVIECTIPQSVDDDVASTAYGAQDVITEPQIKFFEF